MDALLTLGHDLDSPHKLLEVDHSPICETKRLKFQPIMVETLGLVEGLKSRHLTCLTQIGTTPVLKTVAIHEVVVMALGMIEIQMAEDEAQGYHLEAAISDHHLQMFQVQGVNILLILMVIPTENTAHSLEDPKMGEDLTVDLAVDLAVDLMVDPMVDFELTPMHHVLPLKMDPHLLEEDPAHQQALPIVELQDRR